MSSRASDPVPELARWVIRHELWLLAAAAPFLLFPNRWTPVAFLLLPLAWLARRIATGRFSVPTSLDLPIAILALMAVVGYTISVDAAMSRAKFWGILLQIGLFYGMVNRLQGERAVRTMVGLLLVVTLAVALVSLVGTDWTAVRLLDVPWLYDSLPRLISGLPGSGVPRTTTLFNPREVGGTMAMLLPVALALVAFGRDRRLRALAAAALVVGGALLLLAQSGQALFGFLLAVFFIAVWWRRWLLLAISPALSAAAAYVLMGDPRNLALALLSLDHPIGIGVVLRVDMWSRSLAMVRDMPFTGVGLNTFPIMQSQFYPGLLLGPNQPFSHNQFLQTAVDLGFPGLAGFVWLLLAFYVTLLRAPRRALPRDLEAALVGIGAGVLAYLGNGMLDCLTLGAKPTAALWAMFGTAVAIAHQARGRAVSTARPPASRMDRDEPAPRPSLWERRRVFLPAALAAALAGTILAAPGAAHRNLGTLLAHRAVFAARATGVASSPELKRAEAHLRRALTRHPEDVSTLRHLASVQAWRGEYGPALQSLGAAVALDTRAPSARYAPFELWRAQLQGVPPPDPSAALLRLYSHWMHRYPHRAEHHVELALLWERQRGDAGRARDVVQAGLDRGAQPQGWLSYYISQLE